MQLLLLLTGHQPTKYNTWFKATSPYPIRFRMGYEPYILVSRAMVPLYDERFRGYGFDKVPPTVARLLR
jgi:hypothetical protein